MLAATEPTLTTTNPTRLPADLKCTIIGAGNMGSAFAHAIHSAGLLDSSAVTVIDSGSRSSVELATRLEMNFASADYSAVRNSRLVVIACPNKALAGILEKIAPLLQENTLIVSTLAGTTESSWKLVADKAKVVTVIPNPAFAYAASLSVVEFAPWSKFTADERGQLETLFRAGGSVFETSPKSPSQLPGASAVSGCGPAFVAHQVLNISEQGAESVEGLDLQIASYSKALEQAQDSGTIAINPQLLAWGNSIIEGALDLGFSDAQARILLRGALDGYLSLRQYHSPEQVIPLVAHKGGTTEASLDRVQVFERLESTRFWRRVITFAAVRMGAPEPEIKIDFYDAEH